MTFVKTKASSFKKDWEYETYKRQERKETKKLREQRKNKRKQWEMPE